MIQVQARSKKKNKVIFQEILNSRIMNIFKKQAGSSNVLKWGHKPDSWIFSHECHDYWYLAILKQKLPN